jgi:hypothetical protein
MTMSKQEFLKLMQFPVEWSLLDMYPDELFAEQIGHYVLGHERASEHDRNGAFHWWLRRNPSKEHLRTLVKLTFLDSEPLMGEDVRKYIAKAVNCDTEIMQMLTLPPQSLPKTGV